MTGTVAPSSTRDASFDDLELRSPSEREAQLFAALQDHVARARQNSPYWREQLAHVDPQTLTSREALAGLPLLRKSDLIDLQAASQPFGQLATLRTGEMARLFLSPGPIAEPQQRRASRTIDQSSSTSWRMERALHAAGFRSGDRVANCFSYHHTPAGFMFDDACEALGCAVFPGGVGQTEAQVRAFHHFGLNAYVGTPDFLAVILEKAEALDTPIDFVEKALVSGGALFPNLRADYGSRGIAVRQCYGTAELGLIAYETDDPATGMVIDEHCIVELVHTANGELVQNNEVGEVVVTTFHDHYPLIRLATGDLSAYAPDVVDAAGRTGRRLKGWMGRADQATKVRGMFIHPHQVAAAVARFPEILKSRLEVFEVEGRDGLRLSCEMHAAPDHSYVTRIADAVRAQCRLRADIVLVAPGTLPDDGKVIVDQRG